MQPASDLLTVKMRYKLPQDSISHLIEKSLMRADLLKKQSDNFTWASSMAALALRLQNSQFKGSANWDMVLKNAQNALSYDPYGYRKNFVDMLEKAKDKLR